MKEDRRKARDQCISFAATEEEADTLYREARKEGLSMSGYLRKRLGLNLSENTSKNP